MATPPAKDNNTLVDIHANDAGSQGAIGDQHALGVDTSGRWLRQFCMEVCNRIARNASKQKMGTAITTNKLPHKPAFWDITRFPKLHKHYTSTISHQVEVDIPSTKHETDPQFLLAEDDIPSIKPETNPQFSLADIDIPSMEKTHVEKGTSSNKDFVYEERFFKTYTVTNASQMSVLPHDLQGLKMEGCKLLDVLPNDFIDRFPMLKVLNLINCSSPRSFPYPASLKTLYISECRNFELLPSLESRDNFSFLNLLCISNNCDSLTTFTLNLFPKLKTLSICDCPKFVSFNITGVFMADLALESLEVRDCPGFKSFPDEVFHTPNLRTLTLSNCTNLFKLPNFVASFTSLSSLFLHKCPNTESFPNGGFPSCLSVLSIANCDKLTSQKDWRLENLESLDYLNIKGECIGLESFPNENLLPRNITSLSISSLKSLRKLDSKGFQQLNVLRRLTISCCDILRYLPEEGFPSSLNLLHLHKCPMLTSRLKPKIESKTGTYWRMVAHIPRIEIDGQILKLGSG